MLAVDGATAATGGHIMLVGPCPLDSLLKMAMIDMAAMGLPGVDWAL